MNKFIAYFITGLITSTLVSCASSGDSLNRIAPSTINNGNTVSSQAFFESDNVNPLLNGSANLDNYYTGVLVSVFTGGEADQKNDLQKITYSLSDATPVAAETQISAMSTHKSILFKKKNKPKLKDTRHGNEDNYINEIKKLKNTLKSINKNIFKQKSFRTKASEIYQEGALRRFIVKNDQTNLNENRTAILVKIGKTANFWVSQDELNDVDNDVLESGANYWDNVAYPTITTKFGPAPLPPNDIDGEVPINIFIGKISSGKGLYGYFKGSDAISSQNSPSNKTDMLYINSWMLKKGEASEVNLKSTLIHEFQHLVVFNNKVTQKFSKGLEPVFEDRWLNEGLSTYAEQLGGFGLPAGDPFSITYLQDYFFDPSAYPLVTNDKDLNYGAAYLFVLYLTEQYGEDIVKKLVMSDKSGIANVEAATGEPFKKTFTDWATALLLSGSKTNPRYDFKSVDLHKDYGNKKLNGIYLSNVINNYMVNASVELNNWTVSYIKMDNLKDKNVNLKINKTGNSILTTNLVKLK